MLNLRTAMSMGSAVLAAMPLFAQTLEVPLEFEVASIRRSGPKSVRGSHGGPGSKDPERYTFGQAHLKEFICLAYDVEDFQVSSRFPLDKDTFDIAVNVPPGATKAQFRLMMQNLLAERFHLKMHIESRLFEAYELSIAAGGSKLRKPVTPAAPAPELWLREGFVDLPPNVSTMVMRSTFVGGNSIVVRLKAQNQPIAPFASFLRSGIDLPVVDKTGLAGNFDFMIEFSRQLGQRVEGLEPPTAPEVFHAMREQLGLQLVSKRLPFDVVVVDQADPLPTEN